MSQWFIRFSEFAEFSESSALFRKTQLNYCRTKNKRYSLNYVAVLVKKILQLQGSEDEFLRIYIL